MPVCIRAHTQSCIESFQYLFSSVRHHLGANVNKVVSSSAVGKRLPDWLTQGRPNLDPCILIRFCSEHQLCILQQRKLCNYSYARYIYEHHIGVYCKRFKFVDTHLRCMSLPQQERYQMSLSDAMIISPSICIFFGLEKALFQKPEANIYIFFLTKEWKSKMRIHGSSY